MVSTTAVAVENPREQRGIALAQAAQLRRKGSLWLVPAHSDNEPYTVNLDRKTPRCTCSDHTIGGVKCKHIFAVEYTVRWEAQPDGTTVFTQTKRVTYRQDWPAYNAAQTH